MVQLKHENNNSSSKDNKNHNNNNSNNKDIDNLPCQSESNASGVSKAFRTMRPTCPLAPPAC